MKLRSINFPFISRKEPEPEPDVYQSLLTLSIPLTKQQRVLIALGGSLNVNALVESECDEMLVTLQPTKVVRKWP